MYRSIVPVILVIFCCQNLFSQAYEVALNKWSAASPVEKIYIQYDQEFYVPGESIWFKAYLYGDAKPSSASTNLFVQLLNSRGTIILNNQFPVIGAVANGSMVIPDSLSQGDYYIRAMTPSMIDRENSLLYVKMIPILRASSSMREPGQETFSFRFFPESGHLVNGIPTTVAFKATDQWGQPVAVSGTLKSTDGTTISSFQSYHDGMGKFQLLAQPGKNYIAETEANGIKKNFSLPEVKSSGVNIHVEDEEGGKMFQLSRSEQNKKDYEVVTLVVQINHHVIYENEIGFDDYLQVKGHLLTDSLPSGILHFTLFNKAGLPLAERLAFVDNGEYRSGAKLVEVKKGLGKRKENILKLEFPDDLQKNCSVVVLDASVPVLPDRESIYSRLLMTSDLKGQIHNPAWYFERHGDSTKRAVDDLMLTHGWSRFNWTQVTANSAVTPTRYEPYLSASGTVMDEKKKDTYKGGVMNFYLEADDSTTRSYQAAVDDNGKFRLDSLVYFGNAKLFYAYNDRNGKTQPVSVLPDESKIFQKVDLVKWEPVPVIGQSISSTGIASLSGRFQDTRIRLQEVKELEKVTIQVKGRRKSDVVNEKYTNGVFKSQSKVTLDNISYPSSDGTLNAVDYIRNRVQQVELQGGGFVNRKNFSIRTGEKWPVGIFLNEIPTDIASLRILRVREIALVKFYEAGFVGVGSSYPGGAIAVYTKDKSEDAIKPEKLDHVVYQGYTITKEFFHPDYSMKDIRHPSTDHRLTLLWDPNLLFDQGNKSMEIRFFNNDAGGKYRVIVEGFDTSGKLVRVEKLVE